VRRVVGAVGEPWKRDLVVTAFYTLMRKGELLALPQDALDFEARTIRIGRSNDRSTTKGGHVDTIPMADPLRPYLLHAVRAAGSSALVFPGPDGEQRPPSTDAVAIVQKALRDAGIADGWDHLCRRCKGRGRPYVERHAECRDDLRCPACGMRLWSKAVPRPFTFHALRHTTRRSACTSTSTTATCGPRWGSFPSCRRRPRPRRWRWRWRRSRAQAGSAGLSPFCPPPLFADRKRNPAGSLEKSS
jgi:integrase